MAFLANWLWWIVAIIHSALMAPINTPSAGIVAAASVATPAINATTPISEVMARWALLPWSS